MTIYFYGNMSQIRSLSRKGDWKFIKLTWLWILKRWKKGSPFWNLRLIKPSEF